MATVRITPDVVTSIVAKVRELHDVDRNKIDNTLPNFPEGMGEEMYSLLMPREDQKKLWELLPLHLRRWQPNMGLRIVPHGCKQNQFCPTMYLVLPMGTPVLSNADFSVPGADRVTWDGATLVVYLNEDWSALPTPKSKVFLEKCIAITLEHHKITTASKAACTTMREFLEQHRTVQSAVKEYPAVMAYVDPWLKQAMERVVPKRPRKIKAAKEKIQVDMTKLVTKAMSSQLNIN